MFKLTMTKSILRCFLLALPATGLLAQESLFEFDQPAGFATPDTHTLGDYSVGFSHQSALELSDNINLLPDAAAESGWAYTGNVKASVTGKLLGSQLKGSVGVQYITQSDFSRDNDNASLNLIADLKLRSALNSKLVNLLSVGVEQDFANTSETIYLVRSSGTVTSQTIEDTLQFGLAPAWRAELTGYARFEQYEETERLDSASASAAEQREEFERENYALRTQLVREVGADSEFYGLAQLTHSTGGAATLAALDQRSYALGFGLRHLKGATKYQFELGYGEADTDQFTPSNGSASQQSAVLGQVSIEHDFTSALRFFATVNRQVSVDPIAVVTGQLVTDAVAHLQYSVTPNTYMSLRLEYPHIEVFDTDFAFRVPGLSARLGHRFNRQLNVEFRLKHEEQAVNAAASRAGFTEYTETEAKLMLNVYF